MSKGKNNQQLLNVLAGIFFITTTGCCWWLFLQALDMKAARSFEHNLSTCSAVCQDAGMVEK